MSRSIFRRLKRHFASVEGGVYRDALRKTVTSRAALLLSEMRLGGQKSQADKKIIVIGAGLSGLAAAFELAVAGYDVDVYEARERFGGRVFSIKDLVPHCVVEGGAEFIGKDHPTWMKYSERFELKLNTVPEERGERPLVLGGEPLDLRTAKKIYEEMDKAYRAMDKDAVSVNAAEPWKSPNAKLLDQRSMGDWLRESHVSDDTRRALAIDLQAEVGVLPHWQSYLGWLAAIKGGGLRRYWTEIEVYRCEGGNSQLAKKLVERIGGSRVHLNSPVKAVTTRDDGARVQLANSKSLMADDIILAVPPTVWNRISFDPPLPPELRPQMGQAIKTLIAVESRYWRPKLAPDVDADGPVNRTWDMISHEHSKKESCLAAMSSGPGADEFHAWTEVERDEKVLDCINRMLPGVRGALPKIRIKDWTQDPWTKGGYSFAAPGQITTIGPILHNGLGRLHFAGEHTCYAFAGFMEGALNSGASLARRLAMRDGVAN